MGTNYYAHENVCKCCGAAKEKFHIGKLSGGWQFTFQGYPELNLKSFEGWIEYLKQENVVIKDEYNRTLSLLDFVDIVENSLGGIDHVKYLRTEMKMNVHDNDYWHDERGFSFCNSVFS